MKAISEPFSDKGHRALSACFSGNCSSSLRLARPQRLNPIRAVFRYILTNTLVQPGSGTGHRVLAPIPGADAILFLAFKSFQCSCGTFPTGRRQLTIAG
jgi:hypothetical protein